MIVRFRPLFQKTAQKQMQQKQEQEWIVIRGMGSISGLGCSRTEVIEAYTTGRTAFTYLPELGLDTPVAPLSPSGEAALHALQKENPDYGTLDRTVQMAMVAARQAVAEAGWENTSEFPIGINIGSSRGATGLFEHYHAEFLAKPELRLSPSVSPSTTLGNVASWVAQDLQATGPVISHSVTCSTALQAFANGVAWLKSGMAKRFLVGGAEAPLTPFTVAQMKGIGIYSKLAADKQPCRPLNQEQNTFVLGEGAAVFALERMTENEIAALGLSEVVVVGAVGLGMEQTPSKTGLTPDGQHFQKAMQQALSLAQRSPAEIDAVVVHAPGTKAGDKAEMTALNQVLHQRLPSLFSSKTSMGHSLGASGALSAEMALLILQNIPLEPLTPADGVSTAANPFRHLLINSAGFGGNSASLLLSRVRF